jgi:hypothetical protein
MAMFYPSDELIIGESCGVSKKEKPYTNAVARSQMCDPDTDVPHRKVLGTTPRLRLHESRPQCSRGVGKRSYWRDAPSEPVDKASVAAADNAVLYASVEAFFACRI